MNLLLSPKCHPERSSPTEGRANGVEGSHGVWHSGKSHEILRLRNSPSIVGDAGRIAPLRMTLVT
jgi:hypothetical protein